MELSFTFFVNIVTEKFLKHVSSNDFEHIGTKLWNGDTLHHNSIQNPAYSTLPAIFFNLKNNNQIMTMQKKIESANLVA